MFQYNDPKFKPRRKELRHNQTEEERMLWKSLRRKNIGFKFVRQYSAGPYILDLFCSEKRLGIELDGFQHLANKDYDEERDNYLLMNDIKILRFWNSEISANIDKVLNEIRIELSSEPPLNVRGGLEGL